MNCILLALVLSQSGVQIWSNGNRVSPDTTKLNLNGGSVACTRPRQGEATCSFSGSGSGGSWDGGPYIPACSTGQAVFADGGQFACTSTLTASDVACSGTCVADSEIAGVSGSKVSGAVSLASFLASDPTDCAPNQYATAIAASGNLTCSQVATSQLSGTISDAQLASNYSGVGACGANTWVSTLNDNAAPTCTQPAFSNLSGTASISQGGTTETASTEDAVLVGSGTTDWQAKVLPSCSNATTSKLLYDSSTNTFSCGTDQTGGGSSGLAIYGAASGSSYSVNVAAPGTTLYSKTITTSAGDSVVQSVIVSVLNDSGATVTYTLHCRIGTTTLVSVSDSTTQAASATNRGHYRASCEYAVVSSFSTLVTGRLERYASAAAGASGTGAVRSAWATSSSNWTGSQTFNLNWSSSTTTATQTAYVHSFRMEQLQNP